jgi:hypothetical protein
LTSGSVNQTVIQNSSYLISRNGIYYYSRRVPADLHKRFNKDRVIISLRTRSQEKALRSATTLSDRLERHWESPRLELFHSRELGLSLINHVETDQVSASIALDDALETYLSLKGNGRGKTFFQGAHRSIENLRGKLVSKALLSFITKFTMLISGTTYWVSKNKMKIIIWK